ncbi:protein GAST1-like isoform X2 [Apium graveolens]
MSRKPILMTIFIGIMLLLLGDFNHAIITETPAPQPQPSEDLPHPQPSEGLPRPRPSEGLPHPQPSEGFPMYGGTPRSLQPHECKPRCMGRCAKKTLKKPCMLFCQKCCAKCLCVPPGTHGNKKMCPCYNNWKTKRGGPKCP